MSKNLITEGNRIWQVSCITGNRKHNSLVVAPTLREAISMVEEEFAYQDSSLRVLGGSSYGESVSLILG